MSTYDHICHQGDSVCARCYPQATSYSGGLEWVHRPIEPDTYAFHYCTIQPNVPLSSNPQATPKEA